MRNESSDYELAAIKPMRDRVSRWRSPGEPNETKLRDIQFGARGRSGERDRAVQNIADVLVYPEGALTRRDSDNVSGSEPREIITNKMARFSSVPSL